MFKNEVLPVINNMQYIHPISFISFGNEGEYQGLNEEIDPLFIPITFKYTSRDTPQQNGVVERK